MVEIGRIYVSTETNGFLIVVGVLRQIETPIDSKLRLIRLESQRKKERQRNRKVEREENRGFWRARTNGEVQRHNG